jgi:hypothetical protein
VWQVPIEPSLPCRASNQQCWSNEGESDDAAAGSLADTEFDRPGFRPHPFARHRICHPNPLIGRGRRSQEIRRILGRIWRAGRMEERRPKSERHLWHQPCAQRGCGPADTVRRAPNDNADCSARIRARIWLLGRMERKWPRFWWTFHAWRCRSRLADRQELSAKAGTARLIGWWTERGRHRPERWKRRERVDRLVGFLPVVLRFLRPLARKNEIAAYDHGARTLQAIHRHDDLYRPTWIASRTGLANPDVFGPHAAATPGLAGAVS